MKAPTPPDPVQNLKHRIPESVSGFKKLPARLPI